MKLAIHSDPEFARTLAAALAEKLSERLDDIRLLDAKQAAQVLGLTVATFRNMMEREGIGRVDFGERNTRWSLADLKALIKRREVKGR